MYTTIVMGIFNYIDTFFFISLGITFILILLLVFHFKQRMTISEHKNDTMFEIINNIVKEITVLKTTLVNYTSSSIPFPCSIPNNPCCFSSDTTFCLKEHEKIHINMSQPDNIEKIIVSDDDDEDDYDEEEDEEEEDDEEDEEEEDDEEEQKEPVRIINVDMGDRIEINEILSDLEQELEQQQELGLEQETTMEDIHLEPDHSIHIEKLEDTQESVVEDVSLEISETKQDTAKEIHSKMTLQQLKALVVSKGLSSDPSKLKKPALLKLLEEADE